MRAFAELLDRHILTPARSGKLTLPRDYFKLGEKAWITIPFPTSIQYEVQSEKEQQRA